MKRRLYISGGILAALMLCLLFATNVFWPGRVEANKISAKQPVQIKVVPYGPTQGEIDATALSVTRHPEVQKYLRGANNRMLSFELIDADNKGQATVPPTHYLATFYDYTNNRVITAEGTFKGAAVDKVAELYYQPLPSEDEFQAAEKVLRSNSPFSAALENKTLRLYRPMPPVISQENSNGHGDRIITLALMGGTQGSLDHEIVGINLSKGGIMRFEQHAPPGAMASPSACGAVPAANQSTTPRNTAGQYQLIVSQGQTELWNMLVVRPSVSSGLRGSGIEVRDVKYRGKSVLKRGHVPILNVQYLQAGSGCGPYRDWQYQESMFQTDPASTDPAPGIRLSPSPGTTALENGTDVGNFRGVDIYTQGSETVMVTEMEAGWYRYVMEWRFDNDGTIRPRFGFGATSDTCICFTHHHHAYWRFDFDVVGTNNNVYVSEKGKKFLTPLLTEARIGRNYGSNRRLVIQNASGNEGYIMNPNVTDGNADTFGVGDMWVLQYKGTTASPLELDDGFNSTTSSNAFIHIDTFVNSESVANQDIVVWYGAHLIHDGEPTSFNPSRTGSVDIISGNHVVGPDLKPIQW